MSWKGLGRQYWTIKYTYFTYNVAAGIILRLHLAHAFSFPFWFVLSIPNPIFEQPSAISPRLRKRNWPRGEQKGRGYLKYGILYFAFSPARDQNENYSWPMCAMVAIWGIILHKWSAITRPITVIVISIANHVNTWSFSSSPDHWSRPIVCFVI